MISGGSLAAVAAVARSPRVARLLTVHAMFVLAEYTSWIAVLLYAFDQGGTTTAGLVAMAQLVPGILLGPLAVALADRHPPALLLTLGLAVQGVGVAGAAACAGTGAPPVAVYALAVLGSTAAATVRPAQAVVVPSLATTADALTGANVVLGWAEAASIVTAGLVTGVVVTLGGVAAVLVIAAVLVVTAAVLASTLRVPSLVPRAVVDPGEAAVREHRPHALRELAATGRLLLRRPDARILCLLLTASAVVLGAMDLLFLVLAVQVLQQEQGWVGYLNTAFGLGALLAAPLTARFVGRRLGTPLLAACAVFGTALLCAAPGVGIVPTLTLLAVTGAARAAVEVAARTLLQRTVPVAELGRVFGLVGGLNALGLAVGALLTPTLVGAGGSTAAIVGVGAVFPLAAVLGGRRLRRVDDVAVVPVVEIALLRGLPLFADLPPPQTEALARSLGPRRFGAGATLMRQGDPGEEYYAIAAGTVEVTQDGRAIRRCTRGEGVGEIALLYDVPRTSTVTAVDDVTVYGLDRDPFLAVLTGHAVTRQRAEDVARSRLDDDERRRES